MRLSTPIIAIALVSCSTTNAMSTDTSAATYTLKMIPTSAARSDVALLRSALTLIHPGLYRYSGPHAIDEAFIKLDEEVRTPISDVELWKDVALLLAEIHCDHTKPEPPDALTNFREQHATHLPFRFDIIEGRMIVMSSDSQRGAPPPNAEITAINGWPVPRVLNLLAQAVAYDGSTESAIAAKLSSDGDLMGDDFNEYWPAFYGFPQSWVIQWKRTNDLHLSTSTLAPIKFSAWQALPWAGGRYRNEFYNAIRWRIGAKAAYLRLDTFVNYRNPVDASAVLDGFFRVIRNRRTEHLVLDLRANGGGSEDVSLALGSFLMPAAFVWSKPELLKAIEYADLPSHMDTWGDRDALFNPRRSDFRHTEDGWWERIPQPDDDDDASARLQPLATDHFQGQVSILIGARNGSGATRTIAQLKDKLDARLIGEDAAGSAEGPTAGHIFLLTLPNSGIKVRIPNAWNRTNITHFVAGKGVAADDIVVTTLADTEAGYDQALEVATSGRAAAAPELQSVLAGEWKGSLDYRDYGDDQRVILPTQMIASAAAGSIRLAFTYDDGPGKVVHDQDIWKLSDDHRLLQVGDEQFRVIEQIGGQSSNDITLVAEGSGIENRSPVLVRLLLTRRANHLYLSRLTRHLREPFVMRHAYQLLQSN